MKNKFKIAAILMCAWIGWQNQISAQSDTVNRTDKFGKKYGYWEKKSKDTLLWKGTFYNGEPIHAFIHYYPSKNVKDSLYYYPNSPKVWTVSYSSNGKKLSQGMYINKEKDGQWLYYNQNGVLISEEWYKLGKKNGLFKLMSAQDGTLLKECYWENNKLHGVYKEYYTTGAIRVEMNYKNHQMDGDFRSYYINGKIWTKGQYVADLREGVWTTYNQNGFEIKIVTILHEQIQKLVLGFPAVGRKWIKVNVDSIAYFYYGAEGVVLQLNNGKSEQLSDETDLKEISRLVSDEWLIFLNENFLSSYPAIKRIKKMTEDEAEITIVPEPPFEVICYGDYLKSLNFMAHPPKMPKDEQP